MDPNDRSNGSDRPELPPKQLTERLDDVVEGDELRLNDRDRLYEVVGTDRYSVTVEDAAGNRLTVSQNLQTGDWAIHEGLWWIESVDD